MLPFSGIVHHLAGPSKCAQLQTSPKRQLAAGARIQQVTFVMLSGLDLVNLHTHWTPWSMFQNLIRLSCFVEHKHFSTSKQKYGSGYNPSASPPHISQQNAKWQEAQIAAFHTESATRNITTRKDSIYFCDLADLGENLFRASAPNRKKMARKWILASAGKSGKNRPKIGKIAQKWDFSYFRAIFRIFGRFFPDFPGEAKIHFRAIFFRFGAEARNRFSPRTARSQIYFPSSSFTPS